MLKSEYTDFQARRLVEMAGHIIMTYLLIIDASRDDMFENQPRYIKNLLRQKSEARYFH